jgi:hypothetical protein
MIDSGEIVPIQQYIDRDKYDLSDFAPAAIAYYTVDDTLYAMLWDGRTPPVSAAGRALLVARVVSSTDHLLREVTVTPLLARQMLTSR